MMLLFLMKFYMLILFMLMENSNSLILLNIGNELEISLEFQENLKNNMFAGVVVIISMMVLLYSKIYFLWEMDFSYKMILMIFIFSMIMLIYSENTITMLIGWDGLGISSFLLICYYTENESMMSGLITFFFNRLGDSMLIIFCAIMANLNMLMNMGSLSFSMMLILFLSMITKSSQIPFGVWLPMAMSAPTPISSLVHSSTLVTAGIYVLMKLSYLNLFKEMNILFLMFGLSTFIVAGMFATKVLDFKKSVAYSTFSQLGLILFTISINNEMISFYHLLFHAFFKSSLFVNLGMLMIFSFSLQDFRYLKKFTLNKVFKISFFISSMNLLGLISTSGFISKDYILIMFFNKFIKMMILLFLFTGCLMTSSYSLKFMMFFLIKNMKFMKLSKMINFNFYFFKNFFFSLLLMFYPIYLMNIMTMSQEFFIFLNYKMFFYMIILISLPFVKFIFLMNFKILKMVSLMLKILDKFYFLGMKLNKLFFYFYNLFFMLEEHSQMILMSNMIKINSNFMFNLSFLMNLIFILFFCLQK